MRVKVKKSPEEGEVKRVKTFRILPVVIGDEKVFLESVEKEMVYHKDTGWTTHNYFVIN